MDGISLGLLPLRHYSFYSSLMWKPFSCFRLQWHLQDWVRQPARQCVRLCPSFLVEGLAAGLWAKERVDVAVNGSS